MRYGFTTGSCAAAASKAAAYMLLTGKRKTEITIETPKGIPYTAQLIDIVRNEKEVSCAVEKDGGDDPDITTGALIYAKVSYGALPLKEKQERIDIVRNEKEVSCAVEKDGGDDPDITTGALIYAKVSYGALPLKEKQERSQIVIDGGMGVGRVTKPGLDQPVGNAAINHVPREMIEKEVLQVCSLVDYTGSLMVEIFVPEGENLAEHTFNPRLGIVGGISILGTSGIVEPMSDQAILDTIRVELNQRKAQGFDHVVVSPGNYGLDFMKRTYGYDLDKSVKCSNFIGNTIDMAVELGFQKMLLTGHIGKLIKLSGGIMNTHSKEGDCRMELLVSS